MPPHSAQSPFSIVASTVLPYDIAYDGSKFNSLFENVQYDIAYAIQLLSLCSLILPRGGPASFIVWRNAVVPYQLPRDLRPLDLIPLTHPREPIIGVGPGPDEGDVIYYKY